MEFFYNYVCTKIMSHFSDNVMYIPLKFRSIHEYFEKIGDLNEKNGLY